MTGVKSHTRTSPERLYTIREAALELARQECSVSGHDWHPITVTGSEDPHVLMCGRCGRELIVLDFEEDSA